MSLTHYAVFPSAKVDRAEACIEAWRGKGYKTLVHLDSPEMRCSADVVSYGAGGVFPGYYRVINSLAKTAFSKGADVVTCIGDDMLPPDQGAQYVAGEYFKIFPSGLGVYQGCGDEQGKDETGTPAAARICGSPTFGKEWSERAYQGVGAFCDIYHSYYGDEDLFNVAGRLALLRLEPAVTIRHLHWSWGHMHIQDYHQRNQRKWEHDQSVFMTRKAAGFPGSGLA